MPAAILEVTRTYRCVWVCGVRGGTHLGRNSRTRDRCHLRVQARTYFGLCTERGEDLEARPDACGQKERKKERKKEACVYFILFYLFVLF